MVVCFWARIGARREKEGDNVGVASVNSKISRRACFNAVHRCGNSTTMLYRHEGIRREVIGGFLLRNVAHVRPFDEESPAEGVLVAGDAGQFQRGERNEATFFIIAGGKVGRIGIIGAVRHFFSKCEFF